MSGIVLPLWLLLVGAGTWSTAKLAYRVWNSGNKPGLLVQVATTLAMAAATCGLFGGVLGLQKIFVAVVGDGGDPSQKARALAEGIATSMNCTALALAVWVPSFIALSVLVRRRKGRSR